MLSVCSTQKPQHPFFNAGSQNIDLHTEICSCSKADIGVLTFLYQGSNSENFVRHGYNPSEIQERIVKQMGFREESNKSYVPKKKKERKR